MNKVDKLIQVIHSLKEDMGVGAIANVTNKSSGPVNIAGLPPDQPPVDLRSRNTKGWNIFFKDIVRRNRKKKK
jgi:hypothetical protein